MINPIEKKRAQRLQFMNELYDEADGLRGCPVKTKQLAGKLDLDVSKEDISRIQSIAEHLEGEGLTKIHGAVVTGVMLTHEGVREVEEARSKPDQPTKHFAPVNVIYAGTITNSPIQQGSPGATQSLTVIDQSRLHELESVVRSLKALVDQLGLNKDQQAELEADLDSIQGQTVSPRPKKEVVKPALQSVQRILEEAAGNVTASGLLPTIEGLANSLS